MMILSSKKETPRHRLRSSTVDQVQMQKCLKLHPYPACVDTSQMDERNLSHAKIVA
jgi:hypothetical protein